MSSRKKVRYDNERTNYFRSVALALITVIFLLSAGLSIYTVIKTTDIVKHRGIFQKHRDYSCKNGDGADEVLSTGTRQQLTFDPGLYNKLSRDLSVELNPNANFARLNPNISTYPDGYGYVSVGNVKGLFTFDRLNHTLGLFLDAKEGGGNQANWHMDYIPTSPGKSYVFDTNIRLEKTKADIVAEEVDSDGDSIYTDLSVISPKGGNIHQQHIFMPKESTVKLRFYTQLTGSGNLTILNESVRAIDNAKDISLSQPLVSLSFDDGWGSVFSSAKPVLDQLGVKSTQFIIAESFRSLFSGYMNIEQVKQLQREGHEIASHSLRHCNLTNLSVDNAKYDLSYSRKTLETELNNISGFAYPYGAYSDEINKTAATDYSYVRTTENGYDGLTMDPYRLRAVTIVPEMTMDQFREIIDFAADHRLWVDLVYHQIENSPGQYGVTSDLLREQIAYVKQAGVNIVPVQDAVRSILQQQEKAFGATIKQ